MRPGLCPLLTGCSSSLSLQILVSLPFEREGGATPVITPLIIPNNLQKNQPSLLDLTATILDLYAVAKYMVGQEASAVTRELVFPVFGTFGASLCLNLLSVLPHTQTDAFAGGNSRKFWEQSS